MRRLLLAAALGAILTTPLMAREKPPVFVTTMAVKDKPAVTLDPAKAYVLLRSDNAVPLLLMKVASAEDQAAYDRLRAEALAEARGKYAKKLASYQRSKAAAVKASVASGVPVSEEPIEPTEANFDFVQFGMMATVAIGPMNRFAKSKAVSTYLQEVTPGDYRVYGQLAATPNAGMSGTCFCMGSVRFEARAGEIADLGVIDTPPPLERSPGDSSQPYIVTGQPLFRPAGPDTSLDSRLSGYKIVPAAFRPVGKLPNYFGVAIGRIPAMPGVLRYDRDRIVDLTG